MADDLSWEREREIERNVVWGWSIDDIVGGWFTQASVTTLT